MKCADLPDAVVLDIIATSLRPLGATILEVFEALPTYPQKLVRAKLSKLIRRRLVMGCTCGCRGDFTVIQIEAVRDRLDGVGLTKRNIGKTLQRFKDEIDKELLEGTGKLRCSKGEEEQ